MLATLHPNLPVGTSVGVYPASEAQRAQVAHSPGATAITTATVASDGSVDFDGLEAGTAYFAAGQSGGVWRWTQFSTAPSAGVHVEVTDPEDLPYRVLAPAGQTANLWEAFTGDDLVLYADPMGVWHDADGDPLGATGPQGVTGPQGAVGAQGAAGTQGAVGATGAQGDAGAAGQGAELGYDQITGNVVVDDTALPGDTVIACAEHAFDGGLVMVEFFCPSAYVVANESLLIYLYEGVTNLGMLLRVKSQSTDEQEDPVYGAKRFTPSAGNHTYAIKAVVGASACTIQAGTGGSGLLVPAFVRFTKV